MSEVLSRAVLKLPTSEELEIRSFPTREVEDDNRTGRNALRLVKQLSELR